jgi:hypothetical protein
MTLAEWAAAHPEEVTTHTASRAAMAPLLAVVAREITDAEGVPSDDRRLERGLRQGEGTALESKALRGDSWGGAGARTSDRGVCASERDRVGARGGGGRGPGAVRLRDESSGGGCGAGTPGPAGPCGDRRRPAGAAGRACPHRGKGGHYLLRAKANEPGLYERIALPFGEPVSLWATVRQRDRHGDRREVRDLVVSPELNEWAQLAGSGPGGSAGAYAEAPRLAAQGGVVSH